MNSVNTVLEQFMEIVSSDDFPEKQCGVLPSLCLLCIISCADYIMPGKTQQ